MDFRKAELVWTWYSSSAAQNTFEKSNHAANRTYSDIVIVSISLDKARQQGFNAGTNDDLLIEMLNVGFLAEQGVTSTIETRTSSSIIIHTRLRIMPLRKRWLKKWLDNPNVRV